jgi:TPR repeat protein
MKLFILMAIIASYCGLYANSLIYSDSLLTEAKNGNVRAQTALARCYYEGLGVPTNCENAVSWLNLAAAKGNAEACQMLGVCYQKGHGVKPDYLEAVIWTHEGAELGDAGAQYNMGQYYMDGLFVNYDPPEAFIWYKLAAAQKMALAAFNLGVCYRDGIGVNLDVDEAMKWFCEAGDDGNLESQSYLGRIYYYRAFLKKYEANSLTLMLVKSAVTAVTNNNLDDKKEAYYWSLLAGTNGDKESMDRSKEVAEKISAEDKNIIQSKVKRWTEEHKNIDSKSSDRLKTENILTR